MKDTIKVGITHSISHSVSKADLAITHRSGNLPVLATPALVALMEEAAHDLLLPFMGEDQGSVGTQMEIQHLKATLEGQLVKIEAILTEIDSRKFIFEIEAEDETGKAAKAVHERFLINPSIFLQKAKDRLNKIEK